jgi:hypothetical protein
LLPRFLEHRFGGHFKPHLTDTIKDIRGRWSFEVTEASLLQSQSCLLEIRKEAARRPPRLCQPNRFSHVLPSFKQLATVSYQQHEKQKRLQHEIAVCPVRVTQALFPSTSSNAPYLVCLSTVFVSQTHVQCCVVGHYASAMAGRLVSYPAFWRIELVPLTVVTRPKYTVRL